MGTAALLHPLLPLPKPSLRCLKPRLAFSSRLSIPTAPPLAFLSATIRRSREPAVLLARASSEDEGTAGDLGAAPEQEDAPQDWTAEANPEASEAVAEVEKPPRKPRVKFGDVIGILHQRAIEASLQLRPVPDIRAGDIIELRWFIPGRRRPKLFKGIVIAKNNAGIRSNIRVRRIIQGGGVEITFPLHSPKLKEITVVKHRKVRRAKLYYLKNLAPRFSIFK